MAWPRLFAVRRRGGRRLWYNTRSMSGIILFCVLELLGVQGNALRARAFFDANNVKVGDPLTLTVDFIGDAEFRDLHPPALAKAVDGADW